MSDFNDFDVFDLPSDLVASESVSSAGVRINTLPQGTYSVTLESAKGKVLPADSFRNPGRKMVTLVFKTEEGRKVYTDVSWEPSEDSENTNDSAVSLYSQLELALDMYGQPIREVFDAALNQTFKIEVIESCRVKVGDLPEDKQGYYVNTKRLGVNSPVTFYIREQDADARMHFYVKGHKVRNYVRAITAG